MKNYARLIGYLWKNRLLFFLGLIFIVLAISAEIATLRIGQDVVRIFESNPNAALEASPHLQQTPTTQAIPELEKGTQGGGFFGMLGNPLSTIEDIPELKGREWYDPIIYLLYDVGYDQAAYFFLLFGVGFFIALYRLGTAFGAEFFMVYLGRKIIYQIRNHLFTNMVYYPMTYFNKQRIGNITSIINNDVVVLENFYQTGVLSAIRDPLKIIGFMTYMFYLSPMLTLIVVILAPVLAGLIYLIGENIKKVEKKIREKLADINAILHEVLLNIPLIKLYANEKRESKKFLSENARYIRHERNFYMIRSTASPLAEFFGYIGSLIVLGIGGYQILWGETFFTFSDLLGFAGSLFFISGPLQNLSKSVILIKQSGVSARRIFNLMDEKKETFVDKQKPPMGPIQASVQFNQVWFSYEPDTWIFKDLNLEIPAGQSVALVGMSGGGKSTLVSLIPGLYQPQRGSIKIDGKDIWNHDIFSLRQQISFVTQDNYLFHGTLRENITYGRPNATEKEIMEAIRISCAHDFIVALPDKLDTFIGERGVKLSGGQQQRIALARAIIRKPGLLILDEATSSLDNESERQIQRAMTRIMQYQTTLIIAHRLSTIVNVDRILVLDQGMIVEDGDHESLLKQKGAYYKLYTLQDF